MNKHQIAQTVADNAADVGAATAIGITGWTWLATVNQVLQAIATVVAIITGCYAIYWHRRRIEELDNAGDNDEQQSD